MQTGIQAQLKSKLKSFAQQLSSKDPPCELPFDKACLVLQMILADELDPATKHKQQIEEWFCKYDRPSNKLITKCYSLIRAEEQRLKLE